MAICAKPEIMATSLAAANAPINPAARGITMFRLSPIKM